jgi:hypothetical protein
LVSLLNNSYIFEKTALSEIGEERIDNWVPGHNYIVEKRKDGTVHKSKVRHDHKVYWREGDKVIPSDLRHLPPDHDDVAIYWEERPSESPSMMRTSNIISDADAQEKGGTSSQGDSGSTSIGKVSAEIGSKTPEQDMMEKQLSDNINKLIEKQGFSDNITNYLKERFSAEIQAGTKLSNAEKQEISAKHGLPTVDENKKPIGKNVSALANAYNQVKAGLKSMVERGDL